MIAGLVESLTRLFGAAPREKFDETLLARLDLAEPFNRKKIVVSIMGDRNPFEPEELERVRRLIAEIAEENVKLEAACDPAIKASYRLDPGGLDSPTLAQRYEKAVDVRRAIKRGMRERRKVSVR